MAPTPWLAPTSGATITPTNINYHRITYAGGYWFSLTRGNSTTEVKLRYATDPTGTWGTATLPTPPAFTPHLPSAPGVVSDGTTYAFAIRSGAETRILYATDPSATWTAHDYDATDLYGANVFLYANSTWIAAGQYNSGTYKPAFIATSGTASGTYTFGTAASTTGYDATADAKSYAINQLAYDGSTWVSTSSVNGAGAHVARYSSSLTSGWAAPSSFPTVATTESLRSHANGWWTCSDDTDQFLYTSSPGGTWSALTDAQTLIPFPWALGHMNGWWVGVGADNPVGFDEYPLVSYLAGSGSPSGSFTLAVNNFANASLRTGVYAFDCHGGYFVAGSDQNGEIRYCYVTPVTTTYLRQRQSPVRAPSRVAPVQLRQRQRPQIIT